MDHKIDTSTPSRDSQPADGDGPHDNEPAWLTSTVPPAPQQPSPVAEPVWLKRLDLVDSSRVTGERNGRAPAVKTKKRRGSDKPKPRTKPADRSGRVVVLALAVIAGVLFLCLIALIGIARSPIFAATLKTVTPSPVQVVVAPTWPSTWTPTPNGWQTPTVAPTSRSTPTVTLKPTRIQATKIPVPPSQFFYRPVSKGCQYAAGTFVEGTVNGASGQVAGSHVALGAAPGGQVLQTAITGGTEDPGYYAFTIKQDGPFPGTFYVWVTDANGKPLSDPNLGKFTTNGIDYGENPAPCWLALISFALAP